MYPKIKNKTNSKRTWKIINEIIGKGKNIMEPFPKIINKGEKQIQNKLKFVMSLTTTLQT